MCASVAECECSGQYIYLHIRTNTHPFDLSWPKYIFIDIFQRHLQLYHLHCFCGCGGGCGCGCGCCGCVLVRVFAHICLSMYLCIYLCAVYDFTFSGCAFVVLNKRKDAVAAIAGIHGKHVVTGDVFLCVCACACVLL